MAASMVSSQLCSQSFFRCNPCRLAPLQLRSQRQESSRSSAKGDNDLLSQIADQTKEEEASTSSGKGFGAQKPQKKERARPFTVQLPQDQKETPAQQLEGNVVRVLAAIFVVFIVEGLLLAIAGFLPPDWDDFITKYIYPSFSPTLGVFLAISVVYGLVKTRQGTD